MSSHLLLVITGKTASGKDTVMSKLLDRLPDAKRVVTATSRSPRPGEKNGKDYHFISEDDFKKRINQGGFIEYVSYGGNLYGTQKEEITANLGHNLIWRIDPSRAGQVRDFIREAFDEKTAAGLLNKVVVIYLSVDDEVVVNRLKQRGLSDREITTRMEEDARFWQNFNQNYDHVIENVPGRLDETIDKIMNILDDRLS